MEELLTLLQGNEPNVSGIETLWVLLYSGLLCGFVALTYRICHRGVSYSSNFAHTLILMGMVVAIVMMIVGTNLARAFSLVGALSVIRFRTAVKDPKDTGYMFLAMGVGMAVGTHFYMTALIMSMFISLVMMGLSRIQFVKPLSMPIVLTLHQNLSLISPDKPSEIEATLEKFTVSWRMLLNECVGGGHLLTTTYQIQLRGKNTVSQLLESLQTLPGVNRVVVFDESHSMQV
ncbi:MAG: DUF4956 domain-containing protein [Cyanobacteria bacterium]|nr:DUF4956 domain-containing protein [Cyanobacteriota bacterium]